MQIDLPPALRDSVTVALCDRAAQLRATVEDYEQLYSRLEATISGQGRIELDNLLNEEFELLALSVQVQSVPTPAAAQRQTSDSTVAAANCRERLLAIESSQSPEFQHLTADAALCQLLSALGYTEIVTLWRAVDKWYA